MGKPPLPTLASFLIADSVFQQKGGKWCVIGIFDRIYARSFPAMHHSLGIFLELRDVPAGEHEVRIALFDAEHNPLAGGPRATVNAQGRLDSLPLGFQTFNLPIPREGAYFVEVLFDGDTVAKDIRIMATRIPEKPTTEI
jgi:hypothetical protein